MAIALVRAGTVATGTGTASPTFGQATTAGNLLVCFVLQTSGTSGGPITPTGWSSAVDVGAVSKDSAILYKANCGAGETAPTISTNTTGATVYAILAEFSGVATTTPDTLKGQGAGNTTTPITMNYVGADPQSGCLMVTSDLWTLKKAATATTADTYNNGATATNIANVDSSSVADHYRFAYGVTTGNSVADQDQISCTSSATISSGIVAGASFKPAGGGTTYTKAGHGVEHG